MKGWIFTEFIVLVFMTEVKKEGNCEPNKVAAGREYIHWKVVFLIVKFKIEF